jgi:hypothetical protein
MASFDKLFNIDPQGVRLSTNPFTNAFTENEIRFYDLREPYSKAGISATLETPTGRLDDFLNMNYRVGEISQIPILRIDGRLWMSLTPMEIQSAYVPIMMAQGIVGTAGLGLGYFAIRAASNPDVEEIHVFEIDPRIIRFFKESFRDRPELHKIVIHEQDVRKLTPKQKRAGFDTFFMDVYETMLPDEVVNDAELFHRVNIDMNNYRFWGVEKVFLDGLSAGDRPVLQLQDKAFIKTWLETSLDSKDEESRSADDDSRTMLSQLYRSTTDEDFRRQVYEVLDMQSAL